MCNANMRRTPHILAKSTHPAQQQQPWRSQALAPMLHFCSPAIRTHLASMAPSTISPTMREAPQTKAQASYNKCAQTITIGAPRDDIRITQKTKHTTHIYFCMVCLPACSLAGISGGKASQSPTWKSNAPRTPASVGMGQGAATTMLLGCRTTSKTGACSWTTSTPHIYIYISHSKEYALVTRARGQECNHLHRNNCAHSANAQCHLA